MRFRLVEAGEDVLDPETVDDIVDSEEGDTPASGSPESSGTTPEGTSDSPESPATPTTSSKYDEVKKGLKDAKTDAKKLKEMEEKLKELSPDELIRLLFESDSEVSTSGKMLAASTYYEKTFTPDQQKRLKNVRNDIILDIKTQKDKSNLLIFAKNFLNNTKDIELDPAYIDLLSKLFGRNVKADSPTLTEPWIYNENVEDNVFKLKTVIFFKDPKNVEKWGLYKTEDGKQVPLTIEDVKDKKAIDIKTLLNNAQTKSGEEDESHSLRDIFELKKLSKPADQIKFITGLYEKDGKDRVEAVTKELTRLLNNKAYYSEFNHLEIPGWEEGKDETIKEPVDKFIEEYSDAENKRVAGSASTTYGDIFNALGMEINDSTRDTLIGLFDSLDAAKRATVTRVLNSIWARKATRDKFLAMQVDDYVPGDLKSIRLPLLDFIKKAQAQVDRKRASGEYVPKTKAGMLKSIQGWMGSQDFLKRVPGIKQHWPDIKAAFDKVYKKGKTLKQMENDIVTALS